MSVVLVLFLCLWTTTADYITNTTDVQYNETRSFQINSSLQYVLEFSGVKRNRPHLVWIERELRANYDGYPLMIVARTPTEQLSWKLPLSETGTLYKSTSRIICRDPLAQPLQAGEIEKDNPIVTVSTSSVQSINFTVRVNYFEDFYIKPSVLYNVTVSPNEPRYFFYNFSNSLHKKNIDSNYETVILEVNSEDSVCMTVSIQNATCPVFDLNQDITFRGFYETVSTKGGITIPKFKFPNGFFLVFVAKDDDKACTGLGSLEDPTGGTDRSTLVTFTVRPSITYTDYQNAVLITLGVIGLFYVVFLVSYTVCWRYSHIPREMQYVTPTSGPVSPPPGAEDSISVNALDDETDREVRLCRTNLHLSDLAQKDPRVHKKKSYIYLYNVMTIALFYGLPAIQLVVTYQRVLNQTGEQDLCYYNFLCAHPWGFLSDFNHVFSNVGYVLFGLLFLAIVYKHEKTHQDLDFDRSYGIPQHYGMFYAMAVSLIMEGVLSGSYHVCPNQNNFQFDSSFMYVMAVLCMVKLYQNRHPDINANAYSTFGVLAIAIFLSMVGILQGDIIFLSIFTVIHVIVCLYLTAQIYYMGCWRLDRYIFHRLYNGVRINYPTGLYMLKPQYTARFFLLLVGNLCNWLLIYFALSKGAHLFPLYLLAVFMSNTLLYFMFYIVMKYIHGERVNLRSWFFLVLSLSCAASALYFFFHKAISWTNTPAESRQYNQECSVLRFYDSHDLWHFLSATGMFFTFMVLLTMDDDLSHVHRTEIPVF